MSDPPRALLTLASASVTGPAERMLGDAAVLRTAGYAVELAIDTRRQGTLRAAALERGLAVADELACSRKSGPLEIGRDVLRLRRRFIDGLDLVHSHFSHDHHLALLASAGLRRPPLVVRSLEGEGTGSAWALRRTQGIEVGCHALAASGRLRGLRASGRVAVLEGAVDGDRFSPGSAGPLRSALGVGAAPLLVGCVSRLKYDRRLADLIAAFAALEGVAPAPLLVLIGRGEGRPALAALGAARGLGERLRFAGYWGGERLVEAYRGLDVVVWLQVGNDGTARGVLEAMAVGKPVVSYALPPMEEQLADGAGVLVPAGEVAGLTEALQTLLADPQLRTKVGAAARAKVLGRYTWAQRRPALLAFYQRLRGLSGRG